MAAEGQVAVVTGASSGIGEATARSLVSKGYKVALAARRTERIEALSTELGKEATLAVPTDITDPAACEELVSRTVEYFGKLDILVNNAAVGFHRTIPEGDPEEWRAMFDTNVLGVLYVTRAAVRLMLGKSSGHVVFVSSIGGRRVAKAAATVYDATKHSITAISEGLRMDVSPRGIKVTVVEPGGTQTDFTGNYGTLSYRPLDTEDVAAAILYAVSQPPHVNVNEVLLRSSEQAH